MVKILLGTYLVFKGIGTEFPKKRLVTFSTMIAINYHKYLLKVIRQVSSKNVNRSVDVNPESKSSKDISIFLSKV